jgi:hypothetical protein
MRFSSHVLLVTLLLSGLAFGEEPPWCAPEPALIEGDRYLRTLSLDLRGNVPSLEEYEQNASTPEDIESTVDAWLASPAFAEQVGERIRGSIWGSIENLELLANRNRLYALGSGGIWYYYRSAKAELIRGKKVPCALKEVEYTDSGAIKTEYDPESGAYKEGYVWVDAPYWLPEGSDPIRVCAFDALEGLYSKSGTDCATKDAANDPGCGCGPNLVFCRPTRTADERALYDELLKSMAKALQMRVEALIMEGRPLMDLFFDNRMWVNGPIAHYFKYWSGLYQTLSLQPESFNKALLPDLKYWDYDTWVPIELGPQHAGILTDPLFLFRFQTNRSRANRVWNSFLCKPFQPPDGGIDVTSESLSPNLQERPGCMACHQELEPAASYWGRWPQYTAGYLEPKNFPPVRGDCLECAKTGQLCNDECSQFYLTKINTPEEIPYLGWLKNYVFRYQEHVPHIEQGPKLMAQIYIQNERIPRCVVQKAGEWLLGRGFHPREAAWFDSLLGTFVASNYDYRSLIRAIVTHPNYRRVQ